MTVKRAAVRAAGVFAAILLPAGAQAEDIDLYIASALNGTAPNVLVFLDNTSNWSSNSQAWKKTDVLAKCGTDTVCQGYVNQIFGTNATLTQGQVEVASLKLVLNNLVCNSAHPLSINVGLMMIEPDKGAYTNDSGSTHDTSSVTGVIRKAVLPLNSAACSSTGIIGDLDTIFNNITGVTFKAASNANYGGGMYEAFKYFGGYTNPAGAANGTAGSPVGHIHFGPAPYSYVPANTIWDPAAFTDGSRTAYQSPINDDNSCGKNYILLVGNTWPNADDTALLSNLGFTYATASYPFASGSQPRVGDVWANFLSNTDVSPSAGKQSVYTYVMNVYNASADASQTTLLKSMAKNGGAGMAGYYEVGGDLAKLVAAFSDFLISVSATNSVFASSSLPVSVNTQGVYVNQVFIGMFRPDAAGDERWPGNLKQYKFALDTTVNPATLFLADSNGNAAVDNVTTGFIRQCAVSFWTTDSGTYWQNVPVGQTPSNTCVSSTGAAIAPSTSVYSDLQDGNIVEKGAAGEWLRALSCASSNISGATGTYCGRRIQTCADTSCASLVAFNPNNVTSISADLVNWVAGGNLGDGPATGTPASYSTYNLVDSSLANKVRPTVHGDVVHSRPLALNYAPGTATDAQADVAVFYGAGDGMLHAVDGNQSGTGTELWAFVAPEFFPKLQRLRADTPPVSYPGVTGGAPKDYFFDGGIGAYQERDTATNNLVKTYIYPAMRRGGRMIYAFDASTKPSASTPPTLMWKFGCPNAGNDTGCIGGGHVTHIGQTWSTPRVIRLRGDSNLYVVFGAGYDTCEDTDPTSATMCSTSGMVSGASPKGTGIFVLNAVTGVEAAYIDLTVIAAGAGRVVADVVPVDVNYDGYTDAIYAVDTRGYAWRFNTSDLANAGLGKAPSTWATGVTQPLAHVSDWTSSTQFRKLMNAPDVVVAGGTDIVLFGSGNREQPRAASTAVTTVNNRFYGLRDIYANATANINGTDCDSAGDAALDPSCDLLNVTDTSLDYSSAILSSKGWVFDLTAATGNTKEQVVTTATTLGGVTYFSTFQPTPSSGSSGMCGGLGSGYGYAVNFLTGTLPVGSTYRYAEFTSPGLPPAPVSGVVDVGNLLVPFVLGGQPQAGSGSSLEAIKPKLPIQSRRTKVYRSPTIDTR